VQVQPFWDQWKERHKRGKSSEKLHEYRWLLEEFRISLFAQELGTAKPASSKRLEVVWRECQA
jgi:ATP-dependent helicase HrpA